MTIQIIPAINEDEFEKIAEKIAAVEGVAEKTGIKAVQIDVADGSFTRNTLWHNPADLPFLNTKLDVELHLMINKPEESIDDWLMCGSFYHDEQGGVKRIIFHASASSDPDFVIEKCKKAGKEVGIAIGPDESLAAAIAFKDKIDMFQILAVHPGLPGQKMAEGTIERIEELRRACPNHLIEIDGGVNLENIKSVVNAGANLIVSASGVFKNNEIEKNVRELYNGVAG